MPHRKRFLPATGAIARTATNIRAGARTPVAGIVHAITLLVILVVASKLAAAVPMAVLAGILMVVCYNMGEWHEARELWKHSFGATDKLTNLTSHVHEMTPIVVLRLRNMTAIDATRLKAIQDFSDALHASGRTLLLCSAPSQPARLMAQAEFHRHVGAKNILPNVDAALTRAVELRRAIA